jgi:hypothetical protein
MNPTIALTNLGVDTNVFNEPEDRSPKKDFTLTVTPKTDLWVRLGNTWVTATIREDIFWYQKYRSERSGNPSYTVGWKVPFNRLAFAATGRWLNTRDRPGFEIDARLQRRERNYTGSAEVRAWSKSFIGVTGTWRKSDYEKGAVFLGRNVHDELNHTTRSVGLTLRHQLTPLTGLTFTATRGEDRFEFSTLRDSNSNAFTGGIRLDQNALIKGEATLGYRNFHPLSPGLPDYKGMVALSELSYSVFGITRFGMTAIRDVQYSYDVQQPYYLLTGLSGSVTQQILGPFDALGRAGVQRLEYRDRAGSDIILANRTDRVRSYGAGLGYRFGTDTRMGFNLDHEHRDSDLATRRYEGLKYGISMTYGY